MIVSCGWAGYSSFYAIISALFWVFLSYWWFLSFFAKWKIFFFTALAPTIIYLQTRGDFFSLMFLSWLNFITLFNPYLGGLNGCFSLKDSMYLTKMLSIYVESSLGMSYLYYCLSYTCGNWRDHRKQSCELFLSLYCYLSFCCWDYFWKPDVGACRRFLMVSFDWG